MSDPIPIKLDGAVIGSAAASRDGEEWKVTASVDLPGSSLFGSILGSIRFQRCSNSSPWGLECELDHGHNGRCHGNENGEGYSWGRARDR